MARLLTEVRYLGADAPRRGITGTDAERCTDLLARPLILQQIAVDGAETARGVEGQDDLGEIQAQGSIWLTPIKDWDRHLSTISV